MFSAMSTFLSSLARRLVPLRRRRSIASSGFVASRRPFFPCGAGLRDVVSGSPFVVVKRGRTLRKVVKLPRRVGEQRKKRWRGGGKGDDDDHLLDGDEPCVWRRTILLGRRCQPLEFTGAIHYDCEGQRLWQPRTPPQSSSPLPMSPVRLHPSGLGYMDRA
ncbi:hypothetical protein SEVIR_5G250000v4 [Setaria viridis]|uniref:Uncharacterized protein n=1 Tax=Setaria viridis TaxID=4556 RepID=A0A4U6UHU5_SETVI|nr:uncharacterized protein LOC117858416 [Setaria viridis]TKW15628.1 hypothetical protein SEVIR_5G250000v2 [Setaria viridis]